jgi:hypothetical protein
MNSFGQHRATGYAAVLVALFSLASAMAAEAAGEAPDARARSAILGDETLASNIAELRSQVASLASPARYERLAAWVLPSKSHDDFRFSAEFSQTWPMPALRGDDPVEAERIRIAAELGMRRVPTGGRLVSPVLDLIDAAHESGKLDELRDALQALRSEDEVQQRQRLALLAMTETARGEFPSASRLLDEMEVRLRNATFSLLADRWPETLLLSVTVEHPPLRDASEAMLQRIVSDQIRPGRHAGPAFWNQCVFALLGRLKYLQDVERPDRTGPVPPPFGLPSQLVQWSAVSAGDEATYAQGFPISHWHRFDDRVEKLSAHRDEYLYFCSPLQGNFEVECDISGFGYREGQLAIGGHWLSLHFSHRQFDAGGLRGVVRTVPIEPRLSEVNDWVHYRSVVRDGVCRASINGSLLQTEKLRDTQFPWLVLRSPAGSSTSVRDIRITGTPTIPETIGLSSDPELSGWVRYHLDSVGGATDDWRFHPSLGPNGGIVGRRKVEFVGMGQESLLRYHRPMLEDGVIEYEFEYQPGEIEVAPALGRQAFLLEPAGVRRHWITDGVWDRSGLDPLNRSAPLSAQRCPLVTGWNKLRLSVAGDALTIAVNDQQVLETSIDPTDSRMFGLFHFSDQSGVRVRNMSWSGNWPKTLPALRDQELRDRKIDEMDAQLAKLKDSVEIDFVARNVTAVLKSNPKGGLVLPFHSTFAIWPASDSGESVTLQPEGLSMRRDPSQGFNDIQTSMRYQVVGDFDIVAEFANLKIETPHDGMTAVSLIVVADDPLKTHGRVWHGVEAHPGINRRRTTQVEFDRFRPSGVDISYDGLVAEACDSGKLRIARIGQRMHFLIAEEDSSTFRLLHSADVGDTPLQWDGVRLACGTYDGKSPPSGGAHLNWKNLSMRAARLIPVPVPKVPQGASR